MKEIFGFDSIGNEIIKNFKCGKLHHCNLINGQKGVGKAIFAYNMASIILSNGDVKRTCRLIESGGHTDLFALDISTLDIDGKENTSKKGEISVKQARKVIESIKLTPSISNNKVLIVDSVDNVNVNGQNALLKTLEEPPGNTYIFLICHNINKVINTIQSRSNIINIPGLSLEDWAKALFTNEETFDKNLTDEEIQDLYNLSNHSVGFALEIIGGNAIDMYDKILDLILNKNVVEIQKFANDIDNQDLFGLFVNFLDKIFQNLIEFSILENDEQFLEKRKDIFKTLVKDRGMKKVSYSYDEYRRIVDDAVIYNLDRKQCIIDLLIST
ncbi:MAG: AAA family ATPase [Rickettsiales bacterium]|jgi:DNA polymerase-3 subunit delta'|nr:AAA family ATPase [Rickettsiales bacterium]